jgi:uncharacterized protein Yka (UPF0111/DUF47 family)
MEHKRLLPTYEQFVHLYDYADTVITYAIEAYKELNQLSELNAHLAYHLYQQIGPENMDDEARELIHNIIHREKEVDAQEKRLLQALQTLKDYKASIGGLERP